jgi:hypothetical protein
MSLQVLCALWLGFLAFVYLLFMPSRSKVCCACSYCLWLHHDMLVNTACQAWRRSVHQAC